MDKPLEWVDWHTPSGKVEMICPSNIGVKEDVIDEKTGETHICVVEGIYD